MDAPVPPGMTDRIWRRLDLYIAARAVCEATPDCTVVEPIGVVTVPVELIARLQSTVDGYYPDEPRVRHYES